MGQIVKFPIQAPKFGFKRVRQRARPPENPNQLHLFPAPSAKILSFTSPLSRFEQALLMDDRGDARAADLYQQAIEELDCVADAYCNLGIIESKQGRMAKAFNHFTNSLKHNPRHFEAHYNLGNLYFDINDFRLAQMHYEMAAELEPVFPNVYFNLALVQAINSEHGAAIVSLTRYQALVPAEEGLNARVLLENLKESLAAAQNSRPKE